MPALISTSGSRYESAKVDVSVLGEGIKYPFSGKVAKNRFLKAAMGEAMATWDQHDVTKRGIVTDELVALYEAFGKGGFGLIVSGNVMVNPTDVAPGAIILTKEHAQDGRLDSFKELVQAAKSDGSLFIAQISHGGRQVTENINPHPVSASDVKLDDRMGMSFAKPTPLTVEGIQDVVTSFAETAELAYQAGADGVQIHGAHGYLVAQFLAPSTNKRTDQYGGSLENRSRIVVEIIDAIKQRVPADFSIGIKLNSTEFQEGGFTTEDCKTLCSILESHGIDWIELSGGTLEDMRLHHEDETGQPLRESTKQREAFFLKFSEQIVPALTKTCVYVTGGFRTAEGMVHAIEAGATQGIGMARPAAEEPDLPKKILSGQVLTAAKTLFDPTDFGTASIAAGTAMRQIGERKSVILNTSIPAHLEQFRAALEIWLQEQAAAAKHGMIPSGVPVLDLAA